METMISVSEYAKIIGKSTTYVYNLVKEGKIPSVTFKRGKYIGILVNKP